MMHHTPSRPFLLLATLASVVMAGTLFVCAARASAPDLTPSTRHAAQPAEDDPLAPAQWDDTRPGEALPAQRSFRVPAEFRQSAPGTSPLSASGTPALALPRWLPRCGSAPGFAQPSRHVLFCTWLA